MKSWQLAGLAVWLLLVPMAHAQDVDTTGATTEGGKCTPAGQEQPKPKRGLLSVMTALYAPTPLPPCPPEQGHETQAASPDVADGGTVVMRQQANEYSSTPVAPVPRPSPFSKLFRLAGQRLISETNQVEIQRVNDDNLIVQFYTADGRKGRAYRVGTASPGSDSLVLHESPYGNNRLKAELRPGGALFVDAQDGWLDGWRYTHLFELKGDGLVSTFNAEYKNQVRMTVRRSERTIDERRTYRPLTEERVVAAVVAEKLEDERARIERENRRRQQQDRDAQVAAVFGGFAQGMSSAAADYAESRQLQQEFLDETAIRAKAIADYRQQQQLTAQRQAEQQRQMAAEQATAQKRREVQEAQRIANEKTEVERQRLAGKPQTSGSGDIVLSSSSMTLSGNQTPPQAKKAFVLPADSPVKYGCTTYGRKYIEFTVYASASDPYTRYNPVQLAAGRKADAICKATFGANNYMGGSIGSVVDTCDAGDESFFCQGLRYNCEEKNYSGTCPSPNSEGASRQ